MKKNYLVYLTISDGANKPLISYPAARWVRATRPRYAERLAIKKLRKAVSPRERAFTVVKAETILAGTLVRERPV